MDRVDSAQMPTSSGTATGEAIYDYSQTFLLNSKAGSSKTIYLDFNGHSVSNTAWNSSFTGGAAFVAEPFDTDGSPTTFSLSEQAAIQRVWQRVSEDYAQFDVNVTTQEPPASAIARSGDGDLTYGTRLLVTGTNSIFNSCSCGGVGYLGAFDEPRYHAQLQPAFVFTQGTGLDDKAIAEAASHEIGHNLGLVHEGNSTTEYYAGHGSWAPIMGLGYYRPVSQFSKGEYSTANNVEDDFSVMQSHGLVTRADDFSNTATGASLISAASFNVPGFIESAADVDVFRLESGTGRLSLAANPASVGANLDIRMTLYNATGAVIATDDQPAFATTADVVSGLGAALSVEVASGTFFVAIEGVGSGTPLTGYSDYGSVGRYSFSGVIPSGVPATTTPPTTTVAPTTAPPTTVAPTTAPPTTVAPTTTTRPATTTTTTRPATTTTTTRPATTTTTTVKVKVTSRPSRWGRTWG